MSDNIIPNPKAPGDSTDYIYGERMAATEDRMNFFLNEKIDVKKDKVKDEDRVTVDGLEAVLQGFASFGQLTLPAGLELGSETVVDGMESASNVKKIINILIQLAKDAVDFIMNLINNRISRVDNRTFKIKLDRKRDGIITGKVKYPVGVRRLILPVKISTDPTWVASSLDDVNDFYNNTIKAYKGLVDDIQKVGKSEFSLAGAVSDSIDKVAKQIGMSRNGTTWSTDIIPGNKYFMIDDVQNGEVGAIGIYFQMGTADAKLKDSEFDPSSYVMDNTLSVISKTIGNVRSNQGTISQLYRSFEKTVRKFEGEHQLTTQQKTYLNWLVRFNKKLMTLTVQYVLNSLDTGLDFVKAGVRK